VNPFRLVADGLPDAEAGAATIVVVGARSASGGDDFVLLAAIGDRSHAGSDLLRRSCT
jgi:hypothetical protein